MDARAPVNVVLRSTDGQDPFHERRFALRPGEQVSIGRASSNASKPELAMAPGNAFIDSPVVSREHAILSLSMPPVPATVFTPTVPRLGLTLTDLGSMHGTFVNGHKLEAKQLMPLSNGDLLQFGADVSRNDSFYTARKYVIESTAPSGFPNGFSVPEGETSEDEDEVNAHNMDDLDMTQPPRYGSQNNPVNIDDFEDAQPITAREVIELDVDDTLVEGDVSSSPDLNQSPVSPDKEPEALGQVSNMEQDTADPEAGSAYSSDYDAESLHYESNEDDSPDELPSSDVEGFLTYMSAPEDDSDEDEVEDGDMRPHERRLDAARRTTFTDIEADDEDDEDVEDMEDDGRERENKRKRLPRRNMFIEVEADIDEDEESDEGGLDQDDKENTNVGRGFGGKALLNTAIDRPEHDNPPQSPLAPRPSAPIGVPQLFAPLAAQSPLQDESFATYTTSAQSAPLMMEPQMRQLDSAMPALEPYYQQFGGAFDEPYGLRASDFHMFNTLPPRPSAPRPGPWTTSVHPAPDVTDFAPSYDHHAGPFNGEAAQQTPSKPAHFTYPWSVKPAEVFESKSTEGLVSNTTDVSASTSGEANGVQTPPQAPSSEMSTPPQPKRTKVSIPEIVESPEQPPTPTSVVGSLKRKASVLEEEDAEELTLEQPTEVSAATPVAMSIPGPASNVSERPKKKLRARLGSAAKIALNTTLGAAVAVALMSQVPDAFFQP